MQEVVAAYFINRKRFRWMNPATAWALAMKWHAPINPYGGRPTRGDMRHMANS